MRQPFGLVSLIVSCAEISSKASDSDNEICVVLEDGSGSMVEECRLPNGGPHADACCAVTRSGVLGDGWREEKALSAAQLLQSSGCDIVLHDVTKNPGKTEKAFEECCSQQLVEALHTNPDRYCGEVAKVDACADYITHSKYPTIDKDQCTIQYHMPLAGPRGIDLSCSWSNEGKHAAVCCSTLSMASSFILHPIPPEEIKDALTALKEDGCSVNDSDDIDPQTFSQAVTSCCPDMKAQAVDADQFRCRCNISEASGMMLPELWSLLSAEPKVKARPWWSLEASAPATKNDDGRWALAAAGGVMGAAVLGLALAKRRSHDRAVSEEPLLG